VPQEKIDFLETVKTKDNTLWKEYFSRHVVRLAICISGSNVYKINGLTSFEQLRRLLKPNTNDAS